MVDGTGLIMTMSEAFLSQGMCPWDKIDKIRTHGQARLGHVQTNLVGRCGNTNELREWMKRCAFNDITIIS